MKLQRNLLLEWIWEYPRLTGSIVLFLIMWSAALVPISHEEPLHLQDMDVRSTYIVDTINIPYKPIKIYIQKETKKNRKEIIKMINDTYGENYEEITSKQKDIKLLAQLIQAEAGNQDMNGKRLVADVVLNRLKSERFPNTIKEVIYQDGQFGVISDGSFEKAKDNISDESFRAAKMEIKDVRDGRVLYFNTEKIEGVKNWYQHGDHWFGW